MSDTDQAITDRISSLEAELRELENRHVGEALSASERRRLDELGVEIDRQWDLLRQRRALRDAGQDPDEATPRPAETVEGYQQ